MNAALSLSNVVETRFWCKLQRRKGPIVQDVGGEVDSLNLVRQSREVVQSFLELRPAGRREYVTGAFLEIGCGELIKASQI